MYSFLINIGDESRMTIRKLSFRWRGDCPKQQMLALAECVNLQTLHISINEVEMKGMGRKRRSPLNAHGVSSLREIHGISELKVVCYNRRFTTRQRAKFMAVLNDELKRDKEEGQTTSRRPKVVKRVNGTRILGVEVQLEKDSQVQQLGSERVVLGKRQAAMKGEEKRRLAGLGERRVAAKAKEKRGAMDKSAKN